MFTIGTFASQVGLTPATLRKWEDRYGVPSPQRTKGGTRIYSERDLTLVRNAKRLIGQGMRPAIVFADCDALLALADARDLNDKAPSPPQQASTDEGLVAALIEALTRHDLQTLRRGLDSALFTRGVATFIETVAAPFMWRVGEVWSCGELGVFSEHAASSILESALSDATRRVHCDCASPRILLTTPPGEQHRLGVSMIRSILSAAGADCIDLGSELPLDELYGAVSVYVPTAVGVSISPYTAPRYATRFLRELRRRLTEDVEIWAGGKGMQAMTTLPAGVRTFENARQILEHVAMLKAKSPSTTLD